MAGPAPVSAGPSARWRRTCHCPAESGFGGLSEGVVKEWGRLGEGRGEKEWTKVGVGPVLEATAGTSAPLWAMEPDMVLLCW